MKRVFFAMAALLCAVPFCTAHGAEATGGRKGTRQPGGVSDGAQLYQANCAGCHRPLSSSDKRGRSASQIQNAIERNMGGMGFLSRLTPADMAAIAAALK